MLSNNHFTFIERSHAMAKRFLNAVVAVGLVAGVLGIVGCDDSSPTGPKVTPPQITVQPSDVAATEGSPATFTVVATGDDLQYQWQKDRSDVSGATSASYSISSVASSANGSKYRCVVSNSAGSETSDEATLTVSLTVVAPQITVQPTDVSGTVGGDATFSVTATGTNLTYQWRENGTAIAGATTSSYTKSAVTVSDNGKTYSCIASNSAGADTSDEASLIVIDYTTDTANVDYKGANNVVFFDFSTGVMTSVAHDTWHIAFDGDLNVIANSGNYGSGVSVCSTGTSDLATDFTAWYSDTTKAFTRIDTNANVLGTNWMDLSSMPPTYTNQVYLLKTEAGNFKVQFTGAGMGGTVKMKIAAPAEATADEQTFAHNSEYDYTYINCVSKQAVMVAPKKDAWDIRFGRTEFAMGAMTGGRSSVAINAKGGVEAATAEDSRIDEVLATGALSFSDDILAVGHSWYTFDHSTRTYSVNQNTYVFKTTEGNYAKMQIATFTGPNDEGFWSEFDWLYQADGATTFGQ
jgi:hypothetical protein